MPSTDRIAPEDGPLPPCGCDDPGTLPPRGIAKPLGKVLVVGADRPLMGLLQEWLGTEGYAVRFDDIAGEAAVAAVDLVIVDLPFPRQGGVDSVRRIGQRHPGAPILALSSTFFAGIECCGPVARQLGVACVLPKPATRDALLRAVRRVRPA